jgi:hypothetical protein
VHAQLVPASTEAAQALGSHLEGLNAYLGEHHTPVETVTLAAPEGAWTGLGSGRGAGQGSQQGAGQQAGQEAAQYADAGSPSSPASSQTGLHVAASELMPLPWELDGSAQEARAGGNISVMA